MMNTYRAVASKRHKVHLHVADSDYDALLWAWRQDCARNPNTPNFIQWLDGIVWEVSNAIRAGAGAHVAWNAVQQSRPQSAQALTVPLQTRNGR